MKFLVITVVCVCESIVAQNVVNIINPVRFPYGGPFVGILLALAIPLDLPNYEIFVSYNMEGNYNLPQNETNYSWPPDVSRAFPIDRKFAYAAIERKLKSHGFSGKSCLLRMICEAAEYSMEHTGVLADVLHVILSPSTSTSEGLADYELAEKRGSKEKCCDEYVDECEISLLGVISTGDIIAKFRPSTFERYSPTARRPSMSNPKLLNQHARNMIVNIHLFVLVVCAVLSCVFEELKLEYKFSKYGIF